MNIIKELNVKRLEDICGRELTIFQKLAIDGWAKEYEKTVISEYKRQFEHSFVENLGKSINYYLIAIAFTLHFGETTKYGSKRLNSVMADIQETVDLLGRKKYTAKEYLQMLEDDGIDINVKL